MIGVWGVQLICWAGVYLVWRCRLRCSTNWVSGLASVNARNQRELAVRVRDVLVHVWRSLFFYLGDNQAAFAGCAPAHVQPPTLTGHA